MALKGHGSLLLYGFTISKGHVCAETGGGGGQSEGGREGALTSLHSPDCVPI